MARRLLACLFATVCAMVTVSARSQDAFAESLRRQVEAAERAFARSMADRDHAAFMTHLSDQAVFFNGAQALRGKAAVATAWKGYFDDPQAPFS